MQEIGKISSGTKVLDGLLDGGFENGIITTIYGPSGAGKTNFCLLTLIRMTGTGKRVIYIDTESSFSVERLQQITRYSGKVLDNIIFFRPMSFEEQNRIIEEIPKIINEKIGLIVVDTISMLYRLELGQKTEIHKTNMALSRQIAILIKCAREHNLPIIVTNQVYSDFEERDKVKMVGGDILINGSRCLIELENGRKGRCAHLKKHRSLPEKSARYEITERGIIGRKQPTSP